jgi:hypothetical protein
MPATSPVSAHAAAAQWYSRGSGVCPWAERSSNSARARVESRARAATRRRSRHARRSGVSPSFPVAMAEMRDRHGTRVAPLLLVWSPPGESKSVQSQQTSVQPGRAAFASPAHQTPPACSARSAAACETGQPAAAGPGLVTAVPGLERLFTQVCQRWLEVLEKQVPDAERASVSAELRARRVALRFVWQESRWRRQHE